ncbi:MULTISPECIES: NADPH-dependent FMN reductase [unclassified Haladaptatus]|uniref:NADPH-dependent FMN reductase n=1 Tax=unclassified Haladaptatus TaxID=2622732 RepID=UPI0023E86ED7|nr:MULTISPECIES: NADPH-dependent FMN reductase [unclassified Haladaptatus]
MAPPAIVAISGSRRTQSYTKRSLQHALRAAEAAGATTELIDLGAVELPLYHPGHEESAELEALLRTVREADGVMVGSPVYHGSYSSTFKNFHDYCGFDEFSDTAVGLLAVAGGSSYGSTLDHMRITVRGVHGWVMPHQVGIPNVRKQFDEAGYVDPALEARVEKLGTQIVEYAQRLRRPIDEAH